MAWRPRPFWPDEARVLGKLKRALASGEPPQLSRLQVQIVMGWAEEQVGGRYGGRAHNQEERAIVEKLQRALRGES